jgi:membrane fusion protein (multidrug efflux system)
MSKNVKTVLTVIIVLGLMFLIALPKLNFDKEDTLAASATEQVQSGIPVEVIKTAPLEMNNTINVTGSILANESVELTSELTGKISRIYFKEGDKVQKGDVLVRIDDEELRAQLEKLKHTKRLYEEVESRMAQLLERDAISQEEYDIALTESRTSAADIKVLEAQIAKATIRAPFTGIIGLRYVSEGSYISPSVRIANLYSIEPAKVEFSVPGRYSQVVSAGDQIRFLTEGDSEVFTGEVYAIEPQIDPVTRTLLVRALSPNKDRKLIPGQFVRISLTLENKQNAIMVPTMAIVPEADEHLVYVVKDGKAVSQKVNIGFRGAQDVEVVSGLSAGDSVIVAGIQLVKEGSAVRVMSVRDQGE